MSYSGYAQCIGNRYRSQIFTESEISVTEITYGSNQRFNGNTEDLQMDIYLANADTASKRALILIAHGGSFIGGSKTGSDVVPLCKDFARMGYVVASVEYRIGIRNFPIPGPGQSEATEAVMRAVQDARAAVRFFRKNVVENGNTYKIDTSNIYMSGVSAGGFVALQLAYLDQDNEIPSFVDLNQPGLQGGVIGNSGNPGYSSKVKAAINIAGAIGDTAWMQPGNIPVLSLHGTNDGTVPFNTNTINLAGLFPIMVVHGSNSVHIRANNIGITNCFEIHEGAGHVPHVNNAAYYDTTYRLMRDFLLHFVCNDNLNCTSNPIIPQGNTSNVSYIDDSKLKIYPNPSIGLFTIDFPFNTNAALILLDIQGKEIMTKQMNYGINEIEINDKPDGIYFIQIRGNENTIYKKIVIQK